jgi:hydroxymethylpyrimidine/phosphomethylpyrimidine kinase
MMDACSSNTYSQRRGLQADQRAIEARKVVPLELVSTGNIIRLHDETVKVVEENSEHLEQGIAKLERNFSYTVVKIGRPTAPRTNSPLTGVPGLLVSLSILEVICRLLKRNPKAAVIVDSEAIFRLGPEPGQALVAAILMDLFPRTYILFATVPEAKAPLIEAGIPTEHPRGLGDVKSMAQALHRLGPRNVVIKTEMLDLADNMTTLHYAMCGESEIVVMGSRYNDSAFRKNASYIEM